MNRTEISKGKIGLAIGVGVLVLGIAVTIGVGSVILLYESATSPIDRLVSAVSPERPTRKLSAHDQLKALAAQYRQRGRHLKASNNESAELTTALRYNGRTLDGLVAALEETAAVPHAFDTEEHRQKFITILRGQLRAEKVCVAELESNPLNPRSAPIAASEVEQAITDSKQTSKMLQELITTLEGIQS